MVRRSSTRWKLKHKTLIYTENDRIEYTFCTFVDNGGANIGVNGKRFALGIGPFKVPDKRQAALIAAQARDHE